ncbi:predicted protein [Streptomyces sp. SPB78]|nr:predicted protein [Streptomyces sp. SPB78]
MRAGVGEEKPLGAGAATRRAGGGSGTGVAGRVAVPLGSAPGAVAGSSGVAGTVAGSAGTVAGRGEGPL